MIRALALVGLLLATSLARGQEGIPAWTESIMLIEANRVEYSYLQPWSRTSGRARKVGVAVVGERILTTADWMQDSILVRVQKKGRGRWWDAEVDWVDYHANLAVLKVADAAFWADVEPVPLAARVPTRGPVQIWRQSDGNVESWNGAVNRMLVRSAQRSFVRYMTMELTSDIDASGWSEIVTRDDEIVALTTSNSGARLLAIPSPIIRQLIERRAGNRDAALGYFDFAWQHAKNPVLAADLGLEGPPRGIVVSHVRETSAFAGKLLPRDIILEIDGFEIDSDGDYRDPDYGFLPFDNLATKGRFAGDIIKFVVWRAGQRTTVNVALPAADYDDDLVPLWAFDTEPEYLVAGGLVLQPLVTPFLRSWGKDWWKKSPFHLRYYGHFDPTVERPHRIMLSRVLPDPYNLGYEGYVQRVVDRINGRAVSTLRDVIEAFGNPEGRFHVIEFDVDRQTRKLVLDADGLAEATRRIAGRYGIPKPFVIR